MVEIKLNVEIKSEQLEEFLKIIDEFKKQFPEAIKVEIKKERGY